MDMLDCQAALQKVIPNGVFVKQLSLLLLGLDCIVQITTICVFHNNIQIALVSERFFVRRDVRVV